MNAAPSNLQVLLEPPVARIKVTGRGNFNITASFEKLLDELQRNNIRRFVMELSDCRLMDSSFLGVLVGFAARLRDANGETVSPAVELHNPSPTVLKLFDDLSVLDLFQITHGAPATVDSDNAQTVNPGQSSKEETTRACLDAHLALTRQNPENARRFKDVTKFLAEDLEKLRGGKAR